ncbi:MULTISPECIES: gamma-glutamyltransferase family protein [Streptomyces]|uniref:gamma-glutamyltransferase family protein n=1 Tax=Streptomyces lycopersici TaxID=2974589 RepID=UPI00293E2F4A|nr:gamma-glutamyltransferase [Streptomyces sp. NEAU-383]
MSDPRRGAQWVDRRPARGSGAVVAAARSHSTDAALRMLEAGGNAVDAAVACGLVAGVVEPTETTLGGSGFMLVHDPVRSRDWSIEFPARAPRGARPDMFTLAGRQEGTRLVALSAVVDDANVEGPLACGVPATMAGLLAAHEELGRLPRTQVFAPAIELAHNGFVVDSYHALQTLAALPELRAHPDAARIFLTEQGLPPVPAYHGQASLGTGPLLRQQDLGSTLERIADQGRAGLYEGPVARAIGGAFADLGGVLTEQDLASYRPVIGAPLRLRYRDWEVLAPASPCGAWTELQILALLGHFDLGHAGTDRLHLIAQASRRAFADRYHWLADPDFVRVPLRTLLSESYTGALADRVRADEMAPWTAPGGAPPWEEFAGRAVHHPWPRPGEAPSYTVASGGGTLNLDHGTTHFSVIDADGMTVSCTHTAANAFGNKIVPPGTGLLFDSAMAWFNASPGAANSIAPGKRPLANMGPLIARRVDGERTIALGAPGGRRIISAVTQVLSNVVDRGLEIQEAISAPRIDASGTAVLVSERVDDAEHEALSLRGYTTVTVSEEHEPFSYELARPVACAADRRRRTAAADPFTIASTAAL